MRNAHRLQGVAIFRLVGLAGLFGLTACAGPRTGLEIGPDQDFERGRDLVERGRNLDGIQLLESFRSGHPGSDRVDDATFWLGRAHAQLDEHLLAVQEYDRLLADYPQSELREEAEYERARTLFDSAYAPARDPEPTQQAIEAFEAYLRHYPVGAFAAESQRLLRESRDRLAVKAYMNGRTYQQLGKHRAALLYFEKSLRILEDSSRAAQAMLESARSHAELGEIDQARETYQRLIDAIGAGESDRDRLELRARAETELARLATAAASPR